MNASDNPQCPRPEFEPPPLPPGRPSLWGRIAIGFIPAVLFVLGLFLAAMLSGGDGASEKLMNALLDCAFVLISATPFLLILWSHMLLKTVHGPIAPDKRGSRIAMIALVTMGMTIANFLVVFAGCSAILVTMG